MISVTSLRKTLRPLIPWWGLWLLQLLRSIPKTRRIVRDLQFSAENRGPRLLVDVTRISRIQKVTGIPRVIVELCAGLGRICPNSEVSLVLFRATNNGKLIETQRAVLGQQANQRRAIDNREIRVAPGDIFLFPDVVGPPDGPTAKEVKKLQSLGAQVFFICYDLLPITYPHFFTKFARVIYRQWFEAVLESDGVLFISQASQAEFNRVSREQRASAPKKIRDGVMFLGSSQPPAESVRKSSPRNLEGRERFAFLMVGTLQPRKGYSAVLDAFDRLWMEGALHTLTIAGAPGWKTQALVARIKEHPEFGKKLQWWPDADDSSLWELYASSDALIANSVAEGFGLPLVEAAQLSLPIIATRIHPFVEIAGDHAFYIEPEDPAGVERAVREWCNRATQGTYPVSTGIRPRTWDEVAHEALQILLDQPAETAVNDGVN